MNDNYSVLMSVYKKEKSEYLKQSMDSMYKQTFPTNDFVLVCDGPLTKELDAVINEEQAKFGKVLNVVRLPQNGGLGRALNVGVKNCKNELIARMDSDDISKEDRCERQLRVFEENDDISLVSGTIAEFADDIINVTAIREVPQTNDEILNFMKKRNPFNHPCIMYKKSAIESVGGYQDFYLLEDYYLWIRALTNGYKGYNIQGTLLYMREQGMYKRRSGLKYAKSQFKLLDFMKKKGIISAREEVMYGIARTFSSLVPNFIRKKMYSIFVRQ